MALSSAPNFQASALAHNAAAIPAVLFADVAGSTRLYDTLGDTQAKKMVDECIVLLRAIVAQYGGRVIKTIDAFHHYHGARLLQRMR